jgi:hypothetical protein
MTRELLWRCLKTETAVFAPVHHFNGCSFTKIETKAPAAKATRHAAIITELRAADPSVP